MTTGLKRVKEIYDRRAARAEELKAEGKKVIGYLDIYPVVEMLTALDLVPYRLLGDINETITRADACLPTVVCPFLRSVMDLGLKGKYDFLDGVVFAHGCEVSEKTTHIWRMSLEPAYTHFIDTPHTTHRAARQQHRVLLEDFKRTLENLTGQELTAARLRQAVDTHNRQRSLVRELYDLRKPDPPRISGVETVRVMVAVASLPAAEANGLLEQVITEVRERRDGPAQAGARLMTWGSIIDNTALVDLVESLGGNVVMDDTTIGSRDYFPLVEATDDPLDGLADRYLVALRSPRTFRDTGPGSDGKKDYQADLENRFGYLGDYARDWNVNGVILQALRYCDIHGYEVPALKDYLENIGLPSIYLEHDYSKAALAQLRTRVQAFLEIIG